MNGIYTDDFNFYKIGNRKYKTFTNSKKTFTPKARDMILKGQLSVPKGYEVKGNRIYKVDTDKIVKKSLNKDTAKKHGFKTKKELVEFLAKAFKIGKKVLTWSGLEKLKPKLSILNKITKSSFIENLTNSLSHYKDNLIVDKIGDFNNPHFGLGGSKYRVNLEKDFTENYLPDIPRILRNIIIQTINEPTPILQSNDRIKIDFESDTFVTRGLRRGIWFRVSQINELINHALNDIAHVLQSVEKISNVKINVSFLRVPQGNGRNSNMLAFSEKHKNSKGVFQVNTEQYCGFISLAICPPIARKLIPDDKKRKKLTQKEGKDTLRRKTGLKLMELCGISIDNETADIFHFETISEELGICIHIYDVIGKSWIHTNNISSVPNDDQHHVYLYKTYNHFDAILKPKVFFDRSYICHQCCKGFNQQHKCVNKKPTSLENKPQPTKKRNNNICLNCKEDIGKFRHSHKCFMTQGDIAEVGGIIKNFSMKDSDLYMYFDFEGMLENDGNLIINKVKVEFHDGRKETFDNIQDFMLFVFKRDENNNFIHHGYTLIAHYGSNFDFRFVYEWIVLNTDENFISPFTIFTGSKITYMSISKMKLRFVDSYRFFLCPLSDLPKMFGLKELKKGFFPHLFNTPENQNYVGEFPSIKYYDLDGMKKDKRLECEAWYNSQKDKTFDLQKELDEYCESDVDILAQSCKIFKNRFFELIGADPFQYTTLPAYTLTFYRAKFMPKNSIAVFDNADDNQSQVAIEWLLYRQVVEQKKIHTCLDGREATITLKDGKTTKVDGLTADNEVREFYGCFYHGCPHCCPSNVNKYNKTMERHQKIIDAGFKLESIWECEWNRIKKKNDVVNILEQIQHLEPLRVRDAFFGGRTEAKKFFMDVSKMPFKAKIYYRDITSLYPWVMFYKEFPIGHPIIIRGSRKEGLTGTYYCNDGNFDYTLQSYFGLVKCKVKPPKKILYHPVLPHKFDGKLQFPLKTMVGTWTTEEVKKALDVGYTIEKIYEVHHFEEKSNDLFKGYIGFFLKIKQESSGFPKWVQTEEDKDLYIDNYESVMGIRLEKDKIEKNPGLRFIAKIALNNLWGRFGMRDFKDSSKIIRSYEELLNVLKDKNVNIDSLHFELFKERDDFCEIFYETFTPTQNAWTTINPYIAIFTSSYARLKLYEALEVLGNRVIYMDTDSVVYYHEDDAPLHSSKESHLVHGLMCGDMLGEYTDELDNHWIIGWISGGAKNYGYKVCKKEQCEDNCETCNSSCVKVKGFSLSSGNSKNINFETMIPCIRRACIHDNSQNNTLIAENQRIRFDSKNRKMKSYKEQKVWNYQNNKSTISYVSDWLIDSLPLGAEDCEDFKDYFVKLYK